MPGFRTIEGRLNPELIPDEIVWEITFDHWVDVCRRDDPEKPGEGVQAISRYNIFIPEKDTRTLLAVGESLLRDLRALRQPLQDEHAGRVLLDWTPAQRAERSAMIGKRVLAARDELRTKLPSRSFRAVERWIARFKPSLTVQVPEAIGGTHSFDSGQSRTSRANVKTGCGGGGGCDTDECDPQECEAPVQDDCCCSSPILIDQAGDGFKLSNVEHGVLFEIGGPGRARWVAWPVGADDAWLARDLSGNGMIDDGSELFGTATTLRDGSLAPHGYAALAELDTNRDGTVDKSDPPFKTLLLWRDGNRNGVSEPDELSPPADLGIVGFAVKYEWSKRRDEWGNMFALRSSATASSVPRYREAYDVFLLSESPFREAIGR